MVDSEGSIEGTPIGETAGFRVVEFARFRVGSKLGNYVG